MRGLVLIVGLLSVVVLRAQNLEQLGDSSPLRFRAAGGLQLDFYRNNGNDPRQQPFTLTLAGAPVLSLYGVELPFRLFLSNHQRRVQQPFSQFGISPEYRWVKLHLGYSDLFFSPYTLANHRFLGAGVELNPGKLRFGAAYGRFQKTISQEVLNAVPDEDAYLLEEPVPAYRRNAWAVKLGVGSERTYVDLILLRGRDEPESIDSLENQRLRPTENTVAGLSFSVGLGPHLTWTANTAASGFSRDLSSDTIALEDLPAAGLLEQLLNPRESTNLTFAGDTRLAYRKDAFSLGLQYRRIDPGYQSMGAYFFQTDLEEYNLQTTFALAKGKFVFSGLLGLQRDNLYQLRNTTGRRVIGNASANWNPGRHFGLTANYTNFGITQDPTEVATLADTLLLRQVSHNLTVAPRLTWGNTERRHLISLVGGWFALADLRESVVVKAENDTWMAHLNYVLRMRAGGWQYRGGLIFRRTTFAAGAQSNTGFSLGLRKSWWEDKLRCSADGQFFRNQLLEEVAGHTLRWTLRADYRLSRQMVWSLQLRGLQNRDDSRDFSELRASTGLNFNL